MSRGPMLGRAAGRHGSCCGGPPGPDCTDYCKGKKAQRAHEKRQWQREEEMFWRRVVDVRLHGPSADLMAQLSERNHRVDVCLEGSWLVMRVQEKEDSFPYEYAVPAQAVRYVSFYPQEP